MATIQRGLRILILGMMGRCPFGGQTWLYLNWLRAFSRLGHEVYYIEDDTVWPYDPEVNAVTNNCAYAVRHISQCLERIGLADRWAFRLADRADCYWGMSADKLNNLYHSCDVLLNVCGATVLRDEHMSAALRVYVETDPVTAELRLAGGDQRLAEEFDKHNFILTYGENLGSENCRVPLNGFGSKYHPTRQPIDLDLWPMVFDPGARHFTTIGNYKQKGNDVVYQGETYFWSKHHEWDKFIEIPARTRQTFHLAMKVEDSEDRRKLQQHGWQLSSPLSMSLDIFGAYPNFIRKSRGEFTVGKDQNIRMRSAWFSERDVCYLATGKPVIAQDTGFSEIFPVGDGLFAFRTAEEVLEAIEKINAEYERQCLSARNIAQEFFEAQKVGSNLLRTIGCI